MNFYVATAIIAAIIAIIAAHIAQREASRAMRLAAEELLRLSADSKVKPDAESIRSGHGSDLILEG